MAILSPRKAKSTLTSVTSTPRGQIGQLSSGSGNYSSGNTGSITGAGGTGQANATTSSGSGNNNGALIGASLGTALGALLGANAKTTTPKVTPKIPTPLKPPVVTKPSAGGAARPAGGLANPMMNIGGRNYPLGNPVGGTGRGGGPGLGQIVGPDGRIYKDPTYGVPGSNNQENWNNTINTNPTPTGAMDEDGNVNPGWVQSENGDWIDPNGLIYTKDGVYDPLSGKFVANPNATDSTGGVTPDTTNTADGTGANDKTTLTDNEQIKDDTTGYFVDNQGNVYDESGTLVQYADGTSAEDAGTGGSNESQGEVQVFDENGNPVQVGEDTQVSDNSDYIYDDYGNSYDASTGDFVAYADGYDPYAYDDSYDPYAYDYAYEDTGGDYYEAKKGGLITMMKSGGGVKGYADGGTVIDSIDNGDGTYTLYYDDGTTETLNNPNATVYNPDGTNYNLTDQQQNLLDAGYMMNSDGTWTYQDPNSGTQVNLDSNGNYLGTIYAPGITNTGGGNTNINPVVTPATGDTSGFLNNIQNVLSKGGVQGALLGTLFGQLLGGSGSSSSSNQGVNMSQIGTIPARTTTFGIGAPRTVTSDQYAFPTDTGTDIYSGTDLYQNLNAPGFNPVNEPEAPAMATGGLAQPSQTHYTFGKAVTPMEAMGMTGGQPLKAGGLPGLGTVPKLGVPKVNGRHDYRQGARVEGEGDGQSDDIPAMLADGEYVFDAEAVSALGNGSNKAGAEVLDKWREELRAHKRSAPLNKIPPKSKSPLAYLKEAKKNG